MAAEELSTLVRYAFGGQVDAWRRSAIECGPHGLDELIGVVFAEELLQLRQKGLSRHYVNKRESLPVLRGRPDFTATFPWNDRGMTSLTARFQMPQVRQCSSSNDSYGCGAAAAGVVFFRRCRSIRFAAMVKVQFELAVRAVAVVLRHLRRACGVSRNESSSGRIRSKLSFSTRQYGFLIGCPTVK
jgi:hypothetical protein